MGTSLSGLTPATTFDGLLKVGDNDPLTADLKAISDGSGNDSAIQLSTGELKVLGQFNLDSDTSLTTMNLRGDSLVINQIYQANETTYNSIEMLNSAGIRLKNGTGTALLARGGNIGIGGITATPTARLQVKGSGATSATTSLLVQNSAGSDYLKVTDDGNVQLGSSISVQSTGISAYNSIQLKTFIGGGVYESGLVLTGNGAPSKVGIGETTPTARLQVKGSGNDNTTTALLVQNSDAADMLKVTDDGTLQINSDATQRFTIANAAGTAQLNFRYNNIYTSGGNYLFLGGARTIIQGDGSERIIVASTGTTIKGSGATSATTALLVENSAGTDLLKVQDNGAIDFGALGLEFSNDGSGGTMSVASDRYVKIASSLNTYSALNAHVFKTLGSSGYSEAMRITGNTDQFVGIGETTPTARLHIKGSGATSATTALLVENSAGTDLLKVQDDGNVVTASVRAVGNLRLGASGTDRYYVTSAQIHPLSNQDLGRDNSTSYHWNNVYSTGVTHITDNTTSSTTLAASAKLQVDSTTQGFLPPRMTDAERDAIATPAAGLMIYDTTNNQMNYWNGSTWIAF